MTFWSILLQVRLEIRLAKTLEIILNIRIPTLPRIVQESMQEMMLQTTRRPMRETTWEVMEDIMLELCRGTQLEKKARIKFEWNQK